MIIKNGKGDKIIINGDDKKLISINQKAATARPRLKPL